MDCVIIVMPAYSTEKIDVGLCSCLRCSHTDLPCSIKLQHYEEYAPNDFLLIQRILIWCLSAVWVLKWTYVCEFNLC